MSSDTKDSENLAITTTEDVKRSQDQDGGNEKQKERKQITFNLERDVENLPVEETGSDEFKILWDDAGSDIHDPDAGPPKYTKRQLLIFLVYSFTEFATGAIVSLQAPFYPAEAEKKGLKASEYGAVFGAFEFTVFVSSFVFGKYMSHVGPKVFFSLGLFVAGVCCILFGLLNRVEGRTLFFALSMITRICEGLATAACLNAAFTIIALEFPKSVATTFATMETLFAVGLTCGPIIGGPLFQFGGFSVPFFSFGSLLVLVSIFTYIVLPTPIDTNADVEDPKGLLQLLKIPEVILSGMVIASTALSIGHLEATLEPHIRKFDLSSVSVGFIIVISGGMYAISAPLWGKLCDKIPRLNLYMLIGCIFIICGYVLIGPVQFLPFNTILWVTCAGLVLQGIGLGGCLVSSFIQCLTSANAHGFPDNVSTYGMVSGLWASLFSLGNFFGPTLAGVLYDSVGFRSGTLFVIALEVVDIIALGSMLVFGKKPKRGARRRLTEFTESDPLVHRRSTVIAYDEIPHLD